MMGYRIDLKDFLKYVKIAHYQFPDAEVVSIGSGVQDGKWYFLLNIKQQGNEIKFKIPCLKDDVI